MSKKLYRLGSPGHPYGAFGHPFNAVIVERVEGIETRTPTVVPTKDTAKLEEEKR